jgi:hypothetical protein
MVGLLKKPIQSWQSKRSGWLMNASGSMMLGSPVLKEIIPRKIQVYILPIEHGQFYYHLSVEEEDDNIKYFHYAVNKENRK